MEIIRKNIQTTIDFYVKNFEIAEKSGVVEDIQLCERILDRMLTELSKEIIDARLVEKRGQGKTKWWDGDTCSTKTLRARAVNKLTDPENELPPLENVVDAAAYNLMLLIRLIGEEKD